MAARAARAADPPAVPRQVQLALARDAGHAAPDDVQEFAQSIPERYLHCREMSHSWRPFDIGSHKDGGYERTLRCSRCKCKKIQHLDRNGMLVGSGRREYPPGYLAEGLGRIVGEGRGILRLESIRRITDRSN